MGGWHWYQWFRLKSISLVATAPPKGFTLEFSFATVSNKRKVIIKKDINRNERDQGQGRSDGMWNSMVLAISYVFPLGFHVDKCSLIFFSLVQLYCQAQRGAWNALHSNFGPIYIALVSNSMHKPRSLQSCGWGPHLPIPVAFQPAVFPLEIGKNPFRRCWIGSLSHLS